MRPRIAVTLGDPRGIGPEVVARALESPLDAEVTVIGADDQVAAVRADHRIIVGPWGRGVGAHVGAQGLAPQRAPQHPGPSHIAEAGRIAGHAIERAAALALDGEVDAIVTAPIHKHALHQAGFRYPGHTEWLAEMAGGAEVAMMLASDRLRVVLVTTHVALRDVPALVTQDRVVRTGRVTARALTEWFGIPAPRLAVCALNPHGGEGGLFGDEDERVLRPAAAALGAAGPLPADTVFVRAMRGEFDAVLAPYHDVGMTAVKVAGFGKGVNVTLGLPFLRTAPDHGTAFDIAGQDKADAGSMRTALELAVELVQRSK